MWLFLLPGLSRNVLNNLAPKFAIRRLQGDSCHPVEPFLFHPLPGKEGNKMKKIFFLGWLVVFLPAMVFAQGKVEAPVWNIGDKWVFTGEGSIEVINADQNSYALKFSDGICIVERQGYNTIMFEKPTMRRIHFTDGGKRRKYVMGLSKILDFPISIGKEWKSAYSTSVGIGHTTHTDYSEIFKVLGWDDLEVRAGKFKVLILEYKRVLTGQSPPLGASLGQEFKNYYWYSPAVKYFVKCEYDKSWMGENKEVFNWELTFFQLKK